MRLRGAVALVTGGSSGIGAATARALAAAGATPLIAGRDRGRLEAVARQTGGLALEADLGSADGPAALAQAALRAAGSLCSGPAAGPERTGGIDILINNAGVGWSGPLSEMTAEKVTELVAVNLTAPIQLTRLLVPGMAARGRGRVVFVSSIAGATGVRGEAVYAAAKAGLGYFAESLAYELSDRGVGVSVIIPGVIDTPFFERRGTPYERKKPEPLPAERVAQAITSAIARDRSVVYVPRWMQLPAWLHGAAPGAFRILAARFGNPG
ncbi:MAG TPA: SDR family NAD(P)-dependent oxidoreductase [Streptosporangiaceae bacterium]